MPGLSSQNPLTLAVVGCGQRGKNYTAYALTDPAECKVVTIAEPRPKTRTLFAADHEVNANLVFNTWQEMHEASKRSIESTGRRLADALLVSVQDHMHFEVVLAFAEHGYHILCEKPMATNIDECIKIEEAIKKANIIFGMGHVLRYSPYSRAITEIVHSKQLGELVNIHHIEPVGFYHFAHSYVRGAWANEKDSCFSLMTKSCHDIDILCHWLSPATPEKVTSFGGLKHFRKSEKPAAAGNAKSCLDCPVERECPYSAKKIYLDPVTAGNKGWPASTIVDGLPDIENIADALKTGPYGKCVYESDNDVCDNQVVNMQFSSGATVSFTMVAFTTLICDRQTRLHFTHGEIVGDMSTFTVSDFRTRQTTKHTPRNEGGGHGGGDLGLIKTFVEAVKTNNQSLLTTDVSQVLRSHLTVFAAEESRRTGTVVDCDKFETAAREKLARA